MTVSSIVAIIAIPGFLLFLNIGLYVLYRDIHSPLNRNFFYCCLMLSLYTFFHFLQFITIDVYSKTLLVEYSYIPMILYMPFMIKFALLLTDYYRTLKIKLLFHLTAWIAPLLLIYKTTASNAIAQDFPLGFWYIFYQGMMLFYCSIFVILIFIWWKKTKVDREKIQAKISFICAIITVIIAYPIDYFAEYTGQQLLTMIYSLFWMLSLLYVIVQYRFMGLTPNMVSTDIVNSINEAVILFDSNMKILLINKKGKEITGYHPWRIDELSEDIVDSHTAGQAFEDFLSTDSKTFSLRLIYTSKGREIPFQAQISKIFDSMNYVLGVLCVAREILGLTFLQKRFGLTAREIQIVLNILSGTTNLEIAQKLGVTERTVKTHITNIYNKLTVNNKIELYNLLHDFNIEADERS
ncbi:MAG: PAS domain S-box protein [bacterium]|nr:PAS domain S-box protein [bacterium]